MSIEPAQVAVMARNHSNDAIRRILGAKDVDLDASLADVAQAAAAQEEAVDALEAQLDALHACRAMYLFGDPRQAAESLIHERQNLERLQRSHRGLLRAKAQRDQEAAK